MGDERLHSVGVTPPFPSTLAGDFLTRPELFAAAVDMDNMEVGVD